AGDSANDGNQNLAYSTADVTPTIVSLFGAPLRSDFDGVPMQSDAAVLNSIVDPVDLQQALSEAISMFGYPDIGTDLALGTRTVFASIPYFLDGFVTTITDQLQAIVDADIFLVSTLAGVTQFAVQAIGDALVAVTQAVARVVAYATGAGTIAPTDPPLTAPTQSAQVLLTAAQTALVTQSENL
ncbi:MAG: phosphodiesterase, partial [Mycobacterium sp.]|nr:phosphodiesterase [Mycobacterium sp.]